MFEKFRLLFKNTTIYLLGELLARGASFLSIPVVTRFLSPTEYGIVAVVNSVTTSLQIVYGMGFTASSVRHYFDLASDEEKKRYFGSLLLFLALVAFLLSSALMVFGEPLMSPLFKREVPFHPYVTIALGTLFFHVFGILPRSLMRVKEEASRYAAVEVLCALLVALLSVFFVLGEMGALGPLLAHFLVSVSASAYFLRYLRPHIGLTFHWAPVRESLSFGLPTVLAHLGSWGLRSSHSLFLLHLVSLPVTGVYSVSYSVGRAVLLVGTAINNAWTPFFYATAKQEKEEESRRIFSHMATYYALVVVSMGLFLAAFAREVFRILAPENYLAGLRVVPWLILGSLLETLHSIPNRSLYLMKKTRTLPLIMLAAGAVNAALNLVLIPSWGMMGAAWAAVVGSSVMTALTFVVAQRLYYVPYDYGRIAKIFLAAIAVYLMSLWLSPEAFLPGLLARLAILAGYPVVLYSIGFFQAAELRWLRQGLFAFMGQSVKVDRNV